MLLLKTFLGKNWYCILRSVFTSKWEKMRAHLVYFMVYYHGCFPDPFLCSLFTLSNKCNPMGDCHKRMCARSFIHFVRCLRGQPKRKESCKVWCNSVAKNHKSVIRMRKQRWNQSGWEDYRENRNDEIVWEKGRYGRSWCFSLLLHHIPLWDQKALLFFVFSFLISGFRILSE